MKNLALYILGFLLICTPGYLFADDNLHPDIQKGFYHLGGSFSYSLESWSDNVSEQTFSLSTMMEYFVVNKLAIGGFVGANYTNENTIYMGTLTSHFYYFGPSLTYYFWQMDRIASYIQPEIYLEPNTYFTISVAGRVGLDFFLLPSIAIGSSIRYFHRFGIEKINSLNDINFNLGFDLFI
jgi:hypothetical protein